MSRINFLINKLKYAIIPAGTLMVAALSIENNGPQKMNFNDENVVFETKGIFRFIRCIKIGLTVSLDYYFSMLGLEEGKTNYEIMMNRIHKRSAEKICNGCLQNGGCYIKIGQGLVSLSHILPQQYSETLKLLQDKCLSRNKEELYKIFEEDFGKSPQELFKTFDDTPIAAASIAQVYKATTKDDQKVAVKVQYNDLGKRFNSDTKLIYFLLNIGKFLHPKFDFSWIFRDLAGSLKQELDFINEGSNGEKCAQDLKHLNYVYVPKVFWKLCSTRILVTEFIDGIKISDVNQLKENGFSLADVNNKLFECFGYQIFRSGFIHADPHPGNVLLRKFNGKTQLVIIDHGLYQKITKEERFALSHFWKALVLRDHQEMKKYSKKLGVTDYTIFAEILTQSPLTYSGFKLKIKPSKEEEDHMRKTVAEKFDHITNCLQQMPRNLLFVIRNLNTIRSISFDHGCPIDRYAVLARIATKSAFTDEENTLNHKILKVPKTLWLEVNLLISKLIYTWRRFFWKILFHLGVAPDINAIIEATSKNL